MLGTATSAYAEPVEISLWYSLHGPNRALFEKIVADFNKQQTNVKVDLDHFSTQERLVNAGQKALSGDRKKPDLIQLFDTHAPEVIADHKAMMPLYQLLAKYPIKDASWFRSKTTSFVRDAKGQLLAFPMMAEMPVMFYNLDAYRNAGLDPNKPAESWSELQAHLLQLRNEGNSSCPYASSHQVNVHLENLAPMNDKLYLNPDNGFTGKQSPTFNFGTLYMRHLSLMRSWKKVDLMVHSADNDEPDASFADGRCAVLTTTSSATGRLKDSGVRFGVAPLPFYPQESKVRHEPFVGGGALWVTKDRPAANHKAVAEFLRYLSTPAIAAKWHQETGYLPLTDAALRAANVSYYDKTPGVRDMIQKAAATKQKDSRGFRARHYPKARTVLNAGYMRAITGEVPPMEALQTAKAAADRVIKTGQ